VRIVSWNMNHCLRPADDRKHAWNYIRDELRADLALVQEASPPKELKSVYRPIDETNPRLNWGSAVVALRPDLSLQPRRRVPLADCYLKTPAKDELPDSHPGACAVADVSVGSGQFSFVAISLYGHGRKCPEGAQCTRAHGSIGCFPI
jgi:hypothetical protein